MLCRCNGGHHDAFNLVDIASFKDATTRDKSLKHSGKLDKEFGESISIALDKVSPSTHYICFVINSFNGRNLDKGLEGYSFKLHEPAGKIPIAESKFSKSESGEKFTAILMCCLYVSLEFAENHCSMQAGPSAWPLFTVWALGTSTFLVHAMHFL